MFGRRSKRVEISHDERRERQIEQVHALTYALLLDVVAWFLDIREPVNESLFPEYRLPGVKDLDDPRERLRRYCSPHLLAAWEPVRSRWLERGIRVKPDFGTTATLQIEGLDGQEEPRAVARFTDRSVVERGAQRQYNSREWILTAWLRWDLGRIEDAIFRPAETGAASSAGAGGGAGAGASASR
jgi:hypothetical protein